MAPTNFTSVSESSDDSNLKRNGTFQILADGSLDLRALIASFATGSAQRYALDYTQGLVSAAAAPMSLFGLLGYVKGLLKLSLGPDLCERVGFGTEGLRPYFGFASSEIANMKPSDLVQVVYLERIPIMDTMNELRYIWIPRKMAWHTSSSMPLVRGHSWERHPYGNPFRFENELDGLVICEPKVCCKTLLVAIATTLLTTCASSLVSGLALYPMISRWTWSSYYAVFGVMASIMLGTLPWLLIFASEQVPSEVPARFNKDWTLSATPSTLPGGKTLDQKSSLTDSKQQVAYFRRGNAYHVLACRTPKASHLILARVLSFLSVISVTIAYTLQFMQLRIVSKSDSAAWFCSLAGGTGTPVRRPSFNLVPIAPNTMSFQSCE